ncbi:cytochrome c oxidase subunit II [Microvirga splendida]|uniref:Cytochrome aa3 subunit 2 n=1 Tax=Microvirga splendida TaxID=2795727 RepID=A0ABS0Y4N6_9HYPH|nr:cytochrome c oxidase subunit II [Microvirga splendida]MBJ6127005.1 cytochrome c oxidase subunit II [Microvirga splendida]
MRRHRYQVAFLSCLLAAIASVTEASAQSFGLVDRALMWIQSTMVTYGPHAGIIKTLSWVMFAGALLIFLLVMVLATFAIFAPERMRGWMTGRKFIISLGIVFPIVTLTALLVWGLFISRGLVTVGSPALRIEVIGERWWWRVHYVDAEGRIRLVSANEIRIPTGRPIEFVLKTQDVIHSFWVPSLAGKLDMIPGRVNVTRFSAERPGIYRGQCAEYCGEQHALMAFYVVALPQDEFETWYAREATPPAEPVIPLLVRGKALFLENGCGACHTIRGTPAEGVIGPDLTHVGGRLSIAAGTYPNNVGTLAGWISSAQHLKPDNLMPSFGNLQGEELRAIAAYLESLK